MRRAITLRMNKDENAELLGLGPERVEFRIADFGARDIAAHIHSAEAVVLYGGLQLLHSQIGMLQGDCGKGDETIRMFGADFCKPLVLNLDDLGCDVSIELIPVWIDAERFAVQPLLVHGLQTQSERIALRVQIRPQLRSSQFQIHQRQGLRHGTVRVDVNGLDACAVDDNLAAARLRFGRRGARDLASDEYQAGYSTR